MEVEIEEADGGELLAVGAGEDFDVVLVFACDGVPGFPADGLDAEGGAFLGFAEVDGDFRDWRWVSRWRP